MSTALVQLYTLNGMSTALVQLYTLNVKTNELTAKTPNGPRRYSIELSESQTKAKM